MPNHIAVMNERFCAAIRAGDATAAAAVYAANARLLAPGSPLVSGHAAIQAFWKAGITAGIAAADLETVTVIERDDLAVELGRYRLTITAGGADATVDVGKYCVVHERSPDGSWAWAVDTFNSDLPAA
jgi:ketosteroid isomerase-like protein